MARGLSVSHKKPYTISIFMCLEEKVKVKPTQKKVADAHEVRPPPSAELLLRTDLTRIDLTAGSCAPYRYLRRGLPLNGLLQFLLLPPRMCHRCHPQFSSTRY